jgi:hypothetical protein
MQMTTWMLALGLCAGGCAANGPGGDDTGDGGGGTDARTTNGTNVNQSGSRIKMNVLSTPDGAKSFASWRDTELNVDCSFMVAGDGATRCLPVTDTYQVSPIYFADAACTIPVGIRSSCAGPEPRHILRYPDTTTCPSGGYRVFQAGAKYTTGYLRSGASCIALTPSPTTAYYALGTEVAPSTFQSATTAVE